MLIHAYHCTCFKVLDFKCNVGDVVWRKTFYLSDKDKRFLKKLALKFIKCKIISKKSPLVYELEDMNGKFLGSWHIKDIKLTNYTE